MAQPFYPQNIHIATTYSPYPHPQIQVQLPGHITPPPSPDRTQSCSCPHPNPPILPASQPYASIHQDSQGQQFTYVSNLQNSGRIPVAPPNVDPHFPAAHFHNSLGGTGTEPGWDYFFPRQHAKVIVLKVESAPWEGGLGAGQFPFYACHVPHCVTLKELMAGFGAKSTEQSAIHRVYPQGGGNWGHMEEVREDDRRVSRKTAGEMGWCRRDKDGELEVVYLWISRG
ncbi:hypothetical protein QBC38DRAFT_43957 [Podospora fimiseda]|uniref:Uncharacterized protein n=1 Tax=Podospora fimiseda TaxID=252190 RepID=A0AAN7BHX5_9PEZI|nr:hypothetical protein QBC38DRAFT_43957 [Podospora fimiseda]